MADFHSLPVTGEVTGKTNRDKEMKLGLVPSLSLTEI